jgi:hypothetical protein
VTPELASFSDWTLALVPRLFLYPGGLWLLVALLALRFASGGGKSVSPRAVLTDLSHANLLSIAVAWVALALAPFPGATALPSPVDSLVLAALAVLSLLLDTAIEGEGPGTEGRLWAAGAITLALVLPGIESGSLLVPPGGATLFLAVSSLAVAAGLLALCWEGNGGVAGEVRWLAWFCLGVVPLWQRLFGDNPWALSLFVLAGLVVLNSTRRLRPISDYELERDPGNPPSSFVLGIRNWKPSGIAIAIAWLLALPALLWALLAGA